MYAYVYLCMRIIAFVYSTLFNYVYFHNISRPFQIQTWDGYRRLVYAEFCRYFFYFEDNADGSQAPHVAAAEAPEEIHGKRGSVELGTWPILNIPKLSQISINSLQNGSASHCQW